LQQSPRVTKIDCATVAACRSPRLVCRRDRAQWLHDAAKTSDKIGNQSLITSCYHSLILPEMCEESDSDAAPVSDETVVQEQRRAQVG
jgi:hypothetical protein